MFVNRHPSIAKALRSYPHDIFSEISMEMKTSRERNHQRLGVECDKQIELSEQEMNWNINGICKNQTGDYTKYYGQQT